MGGTFYILARARHDRPFVAVATAKTFEEAAEIDKGTRAYEKSIVHEAALSHEKARLFDRQIEGWQTPRCLHCRKPQDVNHSTYCPGAVTTC